VKHNTFNLYQSTLGSQKVQAGLFETPSTWIGSQKVPAELFAPRKAKSVISAFLTDQQLDSPLVDPGAPTGAR
jgi:hypothetical protein